MLMACQKGEFLEEVHEGSGDPEPVSPGDDKIVDVCFFVRTTFRQGAGDADAPYEGKLEQEAGSFVGDEQEVIRMGASPVAPFFQGRVVTQ